MTNDKPKEACGVFGVYGKDLDVSRLSYFGLQALQHRGQESAGIAVGDGTTVTVLKDMGLVTQVFNEAGLSSLTGKVAIGHCRYSTSGGSSSWEAAQPHLSTIGETIIAVAHNGTLVNTGMLKSFLIENGISFRSSSDTEVAAKLIGYYTQQTNKLREGIKKTMTLLEGAYSMVLISDKALYAFRDPHGIRPLCVGKIPDADSCEGTLQRDVKTTTLEKEDNNNSLLENDKQILRSSNGWVVSSETCGLDIVGAEFVRDIKPGELIKISENGLESEQGVPEHDRAFCIFEYIYFARPDSVLDNAGVYRAREAMGRKISVEAPAEADIVIGVPDSGIPSAIGYARESGIVYSEGLTKNRYVGRTFIAPTQLLRQMGIRTKLNPLPYTLRNRRVIVVDDSIVRGNTSKQLVSMLRGAGAKEVHMRIVSPPVVWPCFYGIDTDTQDQLIAANMSIDEIRDFIGADSLAYLSTEGLHSCIYAQTPGYCEACFTGEYPVRLSDKTVENSFKEDRLPTFWPSGIPGMDTLF